MTQISGTRKGVSGLRNAIVSKYQSSHRTVPKRWSKSRPSNKKLSGGSSVTNIYSLSDNNSNITKNSLSDSVKAGDNKSEYVIVDIEAVADGPETPIKSPRPQSRPPSYKARRIRTASAKKQTLHLESASEELTLWKQKMGLNEAKLIGVLGSGDYGRAMAGRLAQSGYTVLLGARDPNNSQIRQLVSDKDGVHLVSQSLSASVNTVLVAVGSDHYRKLPLKLLHCKTVVDVGNWTFPRPPHDPSIAEGLQELVPDARVVKAFNVLSAYALENNVVQGGKQVPVASNWYEAKASVLALVKELNYTPVDFGELRRARDIEDIPLQLLSRWRLPVLFTSIMWALQYLILCFKYQVCCVITGQEIDRNVLLSNLGLLNVNRATAISALWILALCYLPGVIAAYIQLWRGTKYERFPNWLDEWLRSRKQLGLLMLYLGTAHTFLGAAIWSPQYDAFMFHEPEVIHIMTPENGTMDFTVHSHVMTWQGELFMTFGTIAIMVTYLLGVSSLPSVGASLSWREFTFIQSKLGWLTLIAATVHDGMLGFGFEKEHYQACYIASGAQYALLLPLITILLKLPLVLPCVDKYLMDIRKGHERNKKTKH